MQTLALFNEVAFIAATFLIKDQLWFENKEKHEQHEQKLHLAETSFNFVQS